MSFLILKMKLNKNTELEISKWKELLTESKFASPFQTLEYYKLFNSFDGYSSDVFAVEEDNKYTSLIVVTIQKENGIKGYFSKRGIVYAGPLVLGTETKSLDFLLKKVKEIYKRKLIYLEIRNHFDYSSFSSIFKQSGYIFEEHLNVQLSIENIDLATVMSGMNSTRRRQIRQTHKEGAIAREARSEDEIAELYKILKIMYFEKVKLPLFPYEFFLNLYKSKIGKIFVTIHSEKVIGGVFCVYYPNTTMNTFYYTDIRGYHKKIYPAHIALLGAIEFGINNKLKLVDFMGAGKPNAEYGVRDYKMRFGGNLVKDGRFKVIFKPLLYNFGIWGLKLLSKIK